jgi:hypothetical protein
MRPDGDGLYLQMTPKGAVSCALVYRYRGRLQKAGLGAYRYISLDAARAKRDEPSLQCATLFLDD